MSINVSQLKMDIISILDGLKDYTGAQDDAIDIFATQLSDKIGDAIKRGIDTAAIDQQQTAGSYPVTGVLKITAEK
ncbi:MAG: hypothetical protein LBQ74_00015 [Prevotella sp.]|jgi:hypothetical protein|nr:hypothetical protein [Prevotella sp.]